MFWNRVFLPNKKYRKLDDINKEVKFLEMKVKDNFSWYKLIKDVRYNRFAVVQLFLQNEVDSLFI